MRNPLQNHLWGKRFRLAHFSGSFSHNRVHFTYQLTWNLFLEQEKLQSLSVYGGTFTIDFHLYINSK